MFNASTQPARRGAAEQKVGKVEQAQAAFTKLIAEATRSGFYGTATLTLSVQDGHLQQIKLGVERMLK